MPELFENVTKEEKAVLDELLRKSGSNNQEEAIASQTLLAKALTEPLRAGIIVGNTINDLYTRTTFDPNVLVEYPIDLFRADNANEFTAYTIPAWGKIPERQVESDKLRVPIYAIGNSIDWPLKYARDTRWDIVGRALEVMEAGFVQKINDDGWHAILGAAFDRNIIVSDSNADPGQFTKRLVSLMKLVMRRNGGGNSASVNRRRLTHLFVSPESLEDMRNWDESQVDPLTRRELYLAGDEADAGTDIYGIKIVALDELGEGQPYQLYYQNVIAFGAANNGMAVGDLEIVIGVDATRKELFVNPVQEELQVFEDPTFHRQRRQSYYGWMEQGFAILDNSAVLLGSL